MCSCSDVLVASGVALAHATRSEPIRMQPVANPSDGYGRFHVATRALGWGGALATRCDSGESAWMCSRLDVLGVGKARNHRAKTRSRTVADTSQCAAESDAERSHGWCTCIIHIIGELYNKFQLRKVHGTAISLTSHAPGSLSNTPRGRLPVWPGEGGGAVAAALARERSSASAARMLSCSDSCRSHALSSSAAVCGGSK